MSYRYIKASYSNILYINIQGIICFCNYFYSSNIDLDLKTKTALIELKKFNTSYNDGWACHSNILSRTCPAGLYKYLCNNPDNFKISYSIDTDSKDYDDFCKILPDKWKKSIICEGNKLIVTPNESLKTLYSTINFRYYTNIVKEGGEDLDSKWDKDKSYFIEHYLYLNPSIEYFTLTESNLESGDSEIFDLLTSIIIKRSNIITYRKHELDGVNKQKLTLLNIHEGHLKSTTFSVAINLYAFRQGDELFLSDSPENAMYSPISIPFWIIPRIKEGETKPMALKYIIK